MNHVERLAAILLLLQEEPRTSQQIADHFEISRRTVLRDVQALSEMGVPVIAMEGPGGGYSLPASYTPEPLPLTGNEAFLLLLSLSSLSQLSALPFRAERATLLAKLRSLLPKTDASRVEGMLAAASFDIPERRQSAPHLDALLEAARERRWVRVVYRSSERTSTQHLLPRSIYLQEGFWYLRAYAQEHHQERTYRADRIQALEPVEEGFIPEPIQPKIGYAHETHPILDVRLTSRAVARIEIDRHLGDQVERLPDGCGRLTFRCPPSELDWYAHYFASFGEDVEVLAPPDLRERIAQLGRTLVERYS
jgi:predicted DNA-binding transcriptional regulator YafY